MDYIKGEKTECLQLFHLMWLEYLPESRGLEDEHDLSTPHYLADLKRNIAQYI